MLYRRNRAHHQECIMRRSLSTDIPPTASHTGLFWFYFRLVFTLQNISKCKRTRRKKTHIQNVKWEFATIIGNHMSAGIMKVQNELISQPIKFDNQSDLLDQFASYRMLEIYSQINIKIVLFFVLGINCLFIISFIHQCVYCFSINHTLLIAPMRQMCCDYNFQTNFSAMKSQCKWFSGLRWTFTYLNLNQGN